MVAIEGKKGNGSGSASVSVLGSMKGRMQAGG